MIFTCCIALTVFVGMGCSGDGSTDSPVCPSFGIDPQLAGNWIGLDEDGNPLTRGVRIATDGSRETIGTHWSTGRATMAETACQPSALQCVGRNLVAYYLVPGGFDTLSWTVTGDLLTMSDVSIPEWIACYRRVEPGEKITEPVSYNFTFSRNGGVYSAPVIWPRLPVRVQPGEKDGKARLTIICEGPETLVIRLYDLTGPGTYTLGRSYSHQSATYSANPTCSDAVLGYFSHDDSLSTVTVAGLDTLSGRCTGTFDLTLHASGYESQHIIGSFDAPVKAW